MKVWLTLEVEIESPTTKAGRPVGDVIEDRAVGGVKYIDGVVDVRATVTVDQPLVAHVTMVSRPPARLRGGCSVA